VQKKAGPSVEGIIGQLRTERANERLKAYSLMMMMIIIMMIKLEMKMKFREGAENEKSRPIIRNFLVFHYVSHTHVCRGANSFVFSIFVMEYEHILLVVVSNFPQINTNFWRNVY
jgi:hypothetical protein